MTAEPLPAPPAPAPADGQAVWRALASPVRRALLDALRRGPETTGELAAALPDLSRFAVMQHLEVLTDAGLVVVRRRGRYRLNHLNAVPLRRWYERWVVPLADGTAEASLALERHLEGSMSESSPAPAETPAVRVRTVHLENELRFRAPIERVYAALTTETLRWFPHTYGGDRVRSIVFEPRIGGLLYEDWGDGAGHVYAQLVEFDPPRHWLTRGRLHAGTILDTTYDLEAEADGTALLRVSKTAIGPMTEDEAAGIRRYGDLGLFEGALRAAIEG